MTEGIKTHGTAISISSGDSPEGFLPLGECTVVPALGGSNALIDASSHDSEAYMDYLVKDLADGNEISCECIYVPDDEGQVAFKAAYDSKAPFYFLVVLVNGDQYLFPGRVMGWELNAGELDDIVKQTFTVKITGAIVPTLA